MRRAPQWVLWRIEVRDGKPTKVPYQANGRHAKSNAPSTWSTFESVKAAYERGDFAGIGFVFSAGDEFYGADLDGCRNPKNGRLDPWAKKIVEASNHYAEISPTGTGIKIFGRGRPTATGKAKFPGQGYGDKKPGIEIYEVGRYFATTGRRYQGTPSDIAAHPDAMEWLPKEYHPKKPASKSTSILEVGQWAWAPGFDPAAWSSPAKLDEKLRRCRRYVETLDPSIDGERGHDRLYHAAAVVVNDFAIDRSSAIDILWEVFNPRCQPPWNRSDVERKVDEIFKKGGERGAKLATSKQEGKVPVKLGTDEDRVIREVVAAVAENPRVFANGVELVQLIEVDDEPPFIAPIKLGRLRELVTERVSFLKPKQTKGGVEWVPAHSARWSLEAVHQRGDYDGVRPLQAVVDHPIVRPDGSIAFTRGYDQATRLYISSDVAVNIPDRPSRADGQRAINNLLELVQDFPFAGDAHRSAWLAATITPLCRSAYSGRTPAFLVEANARGSGKGLLVDATATILTGRRFAPSPYAGNEEMAKKFTAAMRAGRRIIFLDNVVGDFGGPAIDAFLTSEFWEDRILGVSELGRWPNRAVVYITGNNVAVAEDTSRRICFIRLETPLEKPEDRGGFKHADLLKHIRENRSELLGSALTIVCRYIAAGRPDVNLASWGSFEGWSELVRAALVFAGVDDPVLTRAELQAKGGTDSAAAAIFAEGLAGMTRFGDTPLTAADLISRMKADGVYAGHNGLHLLAILESILTDVTPRSLGTWLGRHDRRRFGDFVIQRSDGRTRGGGFTWAAHRVI